jgi:hypothetical protein
MSDSPNAERPKSGSQSPLVAATPDLLAAFIASASSRLVVLAPAVSGRVAEAIEKAWRQLGRDRVTITLDVDAEVYRLGYGDPAALEILERVGAELGGILHRHPNVRIGLIVADEQVVAYSPVPELIEAGPRDVQAPNAVVLGKPSVALEDALGIGEQRQATQTIGLDKATRDDIDAVATDLAKSPPQKFDVTRRVRAFNAAFQFVELTLHGTSISRRSIQIPAHLLGVADVRTREQLRTVLRIVPPENDISGRHLERARRRIEEKYLKSLPKFGQALLRTQKEEFAKEVKLLEAQVEAFKAEVRDGLATELAARIAEVAAALLPRLLEMPPREWSLPAEKNYRDQAIRENLDYDLKRAVGSVDAFVREMAVRVVYKDVTYESLSNEAFVATARRAFPDLPQLHDEFDAARSAETPEDKI